MTITVKDIESINDVIQQSKPTLSHNNKLLNIWEGDLLSFIEDYFKRELSPESYKSLEPRIAPINILKKIIDKLSGIYPPRRTVINGTTQDEDLLAWYEEEAQANQKWGVANEYFNMFKNTAMQPHVVNMKPKFRAIASDRFIPYSNSKIDPLTPTHIAVPIGTKEVSTGRGSSTEEVKIFVIYSDQNILIVDEKNRIHKDEMIAREIDGTNPFGVLPITYLNRSENFLIPKPDSDTLRMTLLIPVLLSDLNYAVKFQAFSVIVGIDLDEEQLTWSPSSFIRAKSDSGSEKQGSINVVKPEVDIDQVVGLVAAELGMWLQSRSIRPGSVGDISAESFASGISKIVDESDTSDERTKQVGYFRNGEERFWNNLLHHMHPVWVDQQKIDNITRFSANAKVVVDFPEQLPLVKRSDIVASVIQEMNSGMMSKRTAMEKANPDWDEKRIDEELERMEEETTVIVPEDENPEDKDNEDVGSHTHKTASGQTTPAPRKSGDGHDHGPGFSVESGGPGHTHLEIETGERTSPSEE